MQNDSTTLSYYNISVVFLKPTPVSARRFRGACKDGARWCRLGVGGWMHFATLAGISDIDLGISRLVLQIRYVISEIS